MSVFSNISPTLSETAKVQARVKIIKSLRNNLEDSQSPFFSPLLFDIDRVGTKNCENLIGQVAIPVGVAGPLSYTFISDTATHKLEDILIPLATTEGALIASINRGCKTLQAAGTTTVKVINRGMTRAPVFCCHTGLEAQELAAWIEAHQKELGIIGEKTSNHLRLLGVKLFINDTLVFARFAFDTGEAMGMNMVTIAVDQIAREITKQFPQVECLSLSSNVCTDKKVSVLNQRLGRGRHVTVSANLPDSLIQTHLKTNIQALYRTYHAKIIVGSRVAGLRGHNMHVANAAAAIFAATGQDLAHVVDVSQSKLSMRVKENHLLVKLVLPTVPVGIVGGGTPLATQTTARNIICGCKLSSDILASVVGVAALAGELSGLAALSTHTLAISHSRLAR